MKWLISGASGLLGHNLCRYLVSQGQDVVGLYKEHLIDIRNIDCIEANLTDLEKIQSIVLKTSPDIIVYTAGLTDVDRCESNEAVAKTLHAEIPKAMAIQALNCGAKFISISTDHLWNGANAFTTEETPTHPINAYARTKSLGETEVLTANSESLVIRTNFFGQGRPWRKSFSDWVIQELTAGNTITAFTDSFFTPIETTHLCSNIQELTACKASGIYNVAGGERVSKFDFAHRLAKHLGLNENLINPGAIIDANLNAPRPPDMSLSVNKIEARLNKKMPTLNESFLSLNLTDTLN